MVIGYDYDIGDDMYLYRHLFDNYNFGKSNNRTPQHWQVYSIRGKPVYSINTMLYEGIHSLTYSFNHALLLTLILQRNCIFIY